MKKSTRAGMLAAATFAAVVTSTSAASAAPSGKANAVPVANPAQSCTIILDVLSQAGAVGDFRYRDCVRELAGRVPDVEGEGSPYEQCAYLEEEGLEIPGTDESIKVTYPGYLFYPSPDDFLPALRVNDREQCARALYTYHTIVPYLFPSAGRQN